MWATPNELSRFYGPVCAYKKRVQEELEGGDDINLVLIYEILW